MPTSPQITNRVVVENSLLDHEGFAVLARNSDEFGTYARYIRRVSPRRVMPPVLIEVVIDFSTGEVHLDIPESVDRAGWSITFENTIPNPVVQAAVTVACRYVRDGH